MKKIWFKSLLKELIVKGFMKKYMRFESENGYEIYKSKDEPLYTNISIMVKLVDS